MEEFAEAIGHDYQALVDDREASLAQYKADRDAKIASHKAE